MQDLDAWVLGMGHRCYGGGSLSGHDRLVAQGPFILTGEKVAGQRRCTEVEVTYDWWSWWWWDLVDSCQVWRLYAEIGYRGVWMPDPLPLMRASS